MSDNSSSSNRRSHGIVVDTWLRDQKVLGSNPGYVLTFVKVLYMHFLTLLMCKTRTRLKVVY